MDPSRLAYAIRIFWLGRRVFVAAALLGVILALSAVKPSIHYEPQFVSVAYLSTAKVPGEPRNEFAINLLARLLALPIVEELDRDNDAIFKARFRNLPEEIRPILVGLLRECVEYAKGDIALRMQNLEVQAGKLREQSHLRPNGQQSGELKTLEEAMMRLAAKRELLKPEALLHIERERLPGSERVGTAIFSVCAAIYSALVLALAFGLAAERRALSALDSYPAE
jgi:hypothetical protein